MKHTLIALALFAAGCSSLHAELPNSRFESPESTGRHFAFNVNMTNTTNDTITPDASARPPDFSKPTLDDDSLIGLAAALGVADNLDIGLKTELGPSPTMLQLKFQIFGKPSREAKAGDVSLAVTGAYGGGKNTKAGDQSGTFGPGGHNWSGSVEEETTDVALIVGRRLSDNVLLYGGAFYTNFKINSSIDQKASDDGTSPAASYSSSVTAYQTGADLGFQLYFGNSPAFATIEGTYADVHAPGLEHSLLRASAAIGTSF